MDDAVALINKSRHRRKGESVTLMLFKESALIKGVMKTEGLFFAIYDTDSYGFSWVILDETNWSHMIFMDFFFSSSICYCYMLVVIIMTDIYNILICIFKLNLNYYILIFIFKIYLKTNNIFVITTL